jgi:hypothetical protein
MTYVLAMVGRVEDVSSTFTKMSNRITNVEFTIVSPTFANTMSAFLCFIFIVSVKVCSMACISPLQVLPFRETVFLNAIH